MQAAVESTEAWWAAWWSVDVWLNAVGKGAPTAWGDGPKTARKNEAAALCGLLRCIFGNPVRQPPTVPPAVLTWNDEAVRKMAQAIYDEHAFDRLPILADALEDAGCQAATILGHCRDRGLHARGCSVVDLLLGQE